MREALQEKKKILTKAITAALPRLYFRWGFIRSLVFFAIARAGGHRPRKRGKVWAFGHAEFLPCPTAGLSGLGSWGGIEGGTWCPLIPGALPCRDPEEESRTPGAGGREERGRKGEKGKKKIPPPVPSQAFRSTTETQSGLLPSPASLCCLPSESPFLPRTLPSS